MRKILCSLLIVAIMFNFIICSLCYAETDGTSGGVYDSMIGDGTAEKEAKPSDTAAAVILEEGKTSQKNGQEATVTTDSNAGGVSMIGVILRILSINGRYNSFANASYLVFCCNNNST